MVEGPEKTRLIPLLGRCTEGRRSKEGSLDSPASVALCDSPMTRARYRAAGISPMIPEYTSNPPIKSPEQSRKKGHIPCCAVKECGGGRSLLGMINAAATQATGRTTNKRWWGKSPCHLKTGSRGWELQGSRKAIEIFIALSCKGFWM